MMMMGEGAHAPPWQHVSPVSGIEGGNGVRDEVAAAAAPYHLLDALRHYLPSNESAGMGEEDDEAAAVDAYACDEFRMYEFKVRRCARGRSHDWTECPFAHPGEKARRRDPRRYAYSGAACPDFRKGGCKRGDACEYAHGVFECWLHPARYRTQPCKDGTACRRRVCFFAHTPEQLRVLPPPSASAANGSPRGGGVGAESYDGSPLRRQAFESYLAAKTAGAMMSSSPTSTLVSPPRSPPSSADYSPPLSPDAAGAAAFCRGWVGSPVSDVLVSLRQLRLGSSPRASAAPPLSASFLYGSPKSPAAAAALYGSLPSTPTARPSPSAVAVTTTSGTTVTVEPLDLGLIDEEEQPMERVESGRALREKVFERLSKEATVAGDGHGATAAAPDVGWVSDLIN